MTPIGFRAPGASPWTLPTDLCLEWSPPPPAGAGRFDVVARFGEVARGRFSGVADLRTLTIDHVELPSPMRGFGLGEEMLHELTRALRLRCPERELAVHHRPRRVSALRERLPAALCGRDPELAPELARELLEAAEALDPTDGAELLGALTRVAASRLVRRERGRWVYWDRLAGALQGAGYAVVGTQPHRELDGPSAGVVLVYRYCGPSWRPWPPGEGDGWRLLPSM